MIDEILDYKFKNKDLLKEALTHPSCCIKSKEIRSYERLEFLGDAVLSLVIIELLIHRFPNENEGKLAKRKASLVNGETIAKIGTALDLGNQMKMSDAESRLGGRDNPHNIENMLEALIGAIYLDAGLSQVKPIITRLWLPYMESMLNVPIDPKSKLQEDLQKRGLPLPNYELVEQNGPSHMLDFKVRLAISGFKDVLGKGKSKQQAEKEAAILMLEQLHRN